MLQKTTAMFALVKLNTQSLKKITEYMLQYHQIKLDFSIIAMIKKPNNNNYAPLDIFIIKSNDPKQTTYSLLKQLLVKTEIIKVQDKGVERSLTLFGGVILVDGVYETKGSLKIKIDTRNLQANSVFQENVNNQIVLNSYITDLFKKIYKRPKYEPNKELPILDLREPELMVYTRNQLIPEVNFNKNYIDDDDIIQYLKEKNIYNSEDDDEQEYDYYYNDDLDYELKQLGRYRYRGATDFNNFDDVIENNTPYLPMDQPDYSFYSDDEFLDVDNVKTNVFRDVFNKVNVFTDSTLQDDYIDKYQEDDKELIEEDSSDDLKGKFSDESEESEKFL